MTTSPHEKPKSTGAAPSANANVACDECGAFGAFVFEGANLCSRCYSEQGSCCHEFEPRHASQND